MDTNAQHAAPAAEGAPVNGATAEPAAPVKSRAAFIAEAILNWERAMEHAVDMKIDADVAEAHALLSATGKNDATRKAEATIAAADLQRKAEIAQVRARACGAMVDFLLGGRAR